jgi:hypothetical protein
MPEEVAVNGCQLTGGFPKVDQNLTVSRPSASE